MKRGGWLSKNVTGKISRGTVLCFYRILKGMNIMKTKSRLITGILAIAMVFSMSIGAFAAQHTEYPRGGVWNWGQEVRSDGIKYAYSNYYLTYSVANNTTGVHKTTVIGNTTSDSGWVASGHWSYASVPCKWNVIEKSYYKLQYIN